MFLKIKNFFHKFTAAEQMLLLFCVFLPFQFALNPFPGYDLAVIRIIIPIFFCLVLYFNKKTLETYCNNKLSILLLIFLLLALFSLCFSTNMLWSLRKLAFLFSIFPLFFIGIFAVKKLSSQKALFLALVTGASILALIALLQFFSQFVFGINAVYDFLAHNISPFFLGKSFANSVLTYPSWLVNSQGTTFMRAVAIFPDPHMLSYYFGMLIPFAFLLAAEKNSYSKWLYLAAFLLFAADIATFTRGGYIALIIGALIITPLVSKTMRLKIFLGTFLILFFYVIAPHNPVAGRFASSFDTQEGSNQGRLNNWQQAILIIKGHPFGAGIGMYSLAVDPHADYREPIYAHDLYLDIAAELGLQTLLIFFAIIGLAFYYFWKASSKEPFFIAGVSSLSIFAVHSLVETPLYSVHILPLLLLILVFSVQAKKYV